MTKSTSLQSLTFLGDAEYLAFERSSEIRHELLSGRVRAMAGAAREHNLVTGNISAELRSQLKGKPCETYSNHMRVGAPRRSLYTYPDAVVACGTPLFSDDRRDTLINPLLIVEVLSPSAEGYDRGEKFKCYRSIESFAEYVLVAQDRMWADHFVKLEGIWTIRETERSIELVTVPCVLSFSEIYDRVELVARKGAEP